MLQLGRSLDFFAQIVLQTFYIPVFVDYVQLSVSNSQSSSTHQLSATLRIVIILHNFATLLICRRLKPPNTSFLVLMLS